MTGLRTKLTLALGGLLAILVIVSALGVWIQTRYNGALDRFLFENYRSVGYAQQMIDAVNDLDHASDLVLRGDQQSGRQLIGEATNTFERQLGLEFQNITLPGEREAAEKLRDLWNSYQTTYQKVLDANLPLEDRQRIREGPLEDQSRAIQKQAQVVARMNLNNMVKGDGEVKRAAAAARTTMLVLAIAGAGLAVLLIVITSRSILYPLQRLTKSVREVERGNLDLVVKVRSKDEVGQLAEAFNSMAAKLRELRRFDRARLERTQRTTQMAIDTLPTAVAILSPEGKLEMANDAAQRLFGLKPDTSVNDLRADWLVKLFQQVSLSEKPQHAKGYESAVQVFEDGHERFFLPQAVPILDGERKLVGVTVVLSDVTNLRKLDEMKSGLLSVVSHELKTPLTSIRMAVHLLLEERVGSLTAKQNDLLVAAREDADRLAQIIDNLLDIGRMETGRVMMDLKPLATDQLVTDATQPLLVAFQDKGVALSIDVPGDVPPVLADRDRIQLVFSNLLNNALKYTPAGGEVRLTAEADEAFVRITVSDTGVGIPQQYQARIFERFFRAPGQTGGSGAGLGLAIAKDIVEAHGGGIGVESRAAEGSKFTFTLRRADRQERGSP